MIMRHPAPPPWRRPMLRAARPRLRLEPREDRALPSGLAPAPPPVALPAEGPAVPVVVPPAAPAVPVSAVVVPPDDEPADPPPGPPSGDQDQPAIPETEFPPPGPAPSGFPFIDDLDLHVDLGRWAD